MDGLVERKLSENHRHDDDDGSDGSGKDALHGDVVKFTHTSTSCTHHSTSSNKHSSENQSRKRRGRDIFSFIFSVYTATILFAVFISFTCAFLIVRLQELEVFLHHQDGYIRELRDQFEAGKPPQGPESEDWDNRIKADSGMAEYRGTASRHLLGHNTKLFNTDCNCPPGPKGDHGPRGERGRQGSTGREGDKGHRGEPGRHGRDGREGPDGQKGSKGQKGEKGTRGEQGNRGHKGHKGDRGERGVEGPRGRPGILGRRGKKGATGDRGFVGPPGPQGISGELVGVEITELLQHRIKAIHLQGVPMNERTGITRIGTNGIFNQWTMSSCTDTTTFNQSLDGNITVYEKGQYMIYSRVLFYESSAFYGANTNVNGHVFLKCGGARASAALKFGPCQSMGVTELEPGDKVSITSVYPYREVEMSPESTYFGLIKLAPT